MYSWRLVRDNPDPGAACEKKKVLGRFRGAAAKIQRAPSAPGAGANAMSSRLCRQAPGGEGASSGALLRLVAILDALVDLNRVSHRCHVARIHLID